MSNGSLVSELGKFLDDCPLDDFIRRISEEEPIIDNPADFQNLVNQIKHQEENLRILRQRLEYQLRKHKLQEFRSRP